METYREREIQFIDAEADKATLSIMVDVRIFEEYDGRMLAEPVTFKIGDDPTKLIERVCPISDLVRRDCAIFYDEETLNDIRDNDEAWGGFCADHPVSQPEFESMVL